jgi:hypothetical protein
VIADAPDPGSRVARERKRLEAARKKEEARHVAGAAQPTAALRESERLAAARDRATLPAYERLPPYVRRAHKGTGAGGR